MVRSTVLKRNEREIVRARVKSFAKEFSEGTIKKREIALVIEGELGHFLANGKLEDARTGKIGYYVKDLRKKNEFPKQDEEWNDFVKRTNHSKPKLNLSEGIRRPDSFTWTPPKCDTIFLHEFLMAVSSLVAACTKWKSSSDHSY
jgi:hypothetical protein